MARTENEEQQEEKNNSSLFEKKEKTHFKTNLESASDKFLFREHSGWNKLKSKLYYISDAVVRKNFLNSSW